MAYVSQDELEGRVLFALFEYAQSGSGYIEVPIVCGLLNGEFSETRVKMALRALDEDDLLHARHNSVRGSSYEISENGYRKIEAEQPFDQVDLNSDAIPAADRIVRIDHNQPNIMRAITDAKQLAKDLVSKNDIGSMSADEALAASQEVQAVAVALEGEAIRLPEFGERATSTLSWIGKEAAGALVGAAALALLALLGHIFGILV